MMLLLFFFWHAKIAVQTTSASSVKCVAITISFAFVFCIVPQAFAYAHACVGVCVCKEPHALTAASAKESARNASQLVNAEHELKFILACDVRSPKSVCSLPSAKTQVLCESK